MALNGKTNEKNSISLPHYIPISFRIDDNDNNYRCNEA